MLIKLPLLVLLSWGFSSRMKSDPILCLAFFCTYGTFIPNTANDYSLVTAMPFALVLMHRALRPETRKGEWIFFLIITYAFFGDRSPFWWIHFKLGHQFLFIGCFIALPILLAKRDFYLPDPVSEIPWEPSAVSADE